MRIEWIWFFLIGLLVGWFASLLFIPQARRYGSLALFVLTVIGAVAGGLAGQRISLDNPMVVSLLMSVLGAVFLVLIVGAVLVFISPPSSDGR